MIDLGTVISGVGFFVFFGAYLVLSGQSELKRAGSEFDRLLGRYRFWGGIALLALAISLVWVSWPDIRSLPWQ